MKNIIVAFLLLFIVNCEPAAKPIENNTINSTATLEQKLDKNPFLVDVRTPAEFAQGSVKGAVNIPLEDLQARISEFKGKENIITFCRTGHRSGQAIEILKENGITDVTNGTNAENIEALNNK
ncbi:rhodanese-like domain-containing protein [Halpernia frigidisoli]|uniref:Rhodanese-related sulfurtransferase n=1 Tax=Halpernia frigidisoli TaxID=1125876 RepID=A0A1I3HZ93_9FLAO|nr:rhodanese-like domain-containing protein [Halpernia frigidisoli]SFI40910.1 Rhodanese-related sulfurtransferase [Halpernia frigidisoli]